MSTLQSSIYWQNHGHIMNKQAKDEFRRIIMNDTFMQIEINLKKVGPMFPNLPKNNSF